MKIQKKQQKSSSKDLETLSCDLPTIVSDMLIKGVPKTKPAFIKLLNAYLRVTKSKMPRVQLNSNLESIVPVIMMKCFIELGGLTFQLSVRLRGAAY
jgi:hypothetical protein